MERIQRQQGKSVLWQIIPSVLYLIRRIIREEIRCNSPEIMVLSIQKEGDRITVKEKIKAACDVAGMSLTELGKKMGMSQQNFSSRLNVGKFTPEEYEEMAKHLGCKYISRFEFPDGTRI